MRIAILLAVLTIASVAQTQTTQPSSEDRLNQMLQPPAGGAVRPLAPTTSPSIDRTTASAVAPNAPAVTVLREGTFLVDRTGRLVKGVDPTSWEFAFEADGKTMKDPPVVILPNLKLMAMVDAMKNANRDLRFKITGMVTEFNGRNYVLLEKVLVVPETQRL